MHMFTYSRASSPLRFMQEAAKEMPRWQLTHEDPAQGVCPECSIIVPADSLSCAATQPLTIMLFNLCMQVS